MHREGVFTHHRLDTLPGLAAGGTPTAQVVLGPVPEGFCWYIEGIGFAVVGNSHTAAVDVAVTPDGGTLPAQASWDHAGLVWKFDSGTAIAAIAGSSKMLTPIYMGPGHFAHAYFSGGTLAAGDAVTVTFQVAVHELNPRFVLSPEEIEQVARSHERYPAHEIAEVATAGERAV